MHRGRPRWRISFVDPISFAELRAGEYCIVIIEFARVDIGCGGAGRRSLSLTLSVGCGTSSAQDIL